ncbi:MAG: hypothetical protein ACYDEY_05000 [Acidimicrobiales bacterium]
MNPRHSGRREPCTLHDARARLHDADAFLEAATAGTDPDVIATNAIHAAIAAADAICCVALRERSSDGNHIAAVDLLTGIDQRLAATLKRTLDRKTQAAYESRDMAVGDAATCVRQATTLVAEARRRVLSC